MKLTAKERKALKIFEKPRDQRDYGNIHANSIHALQRKGLVTDTHKLTKAGRDELKGPKKCDPERALAAAEVLEAVWLSEKHFELDHEIEDPPIAEMDGEDHVWVTVKIHVPALDIDMWIDGTHSDRPDNIDD